MPCCQRQDTTVAGILPLSTPIQYVQAYQQKGVCMLYNLNFMYTDNNLWAKSNLKGPWDIAKVF